MPHQETGLNNSWMWPGDLKVQDGKKPGQTLSAHRDPMACEGMLKSGIPGKTVSRSLSDLQQVTQPACCSNLSSLRSETNQTQVQTQRSL